MEDNSDELFDEQNKAVQSHVSLPQDVQRIIIASLSGRAVLKFRRVCKFWQGCIEEPTFVDRHLNNALRFHHSIAFFTSVNNGLVHMYTFDPTTMNFKRMELVFSRRFYMSNPCNGLVCAYDVDGGAEVLNPTTMKHLTLPASELASLAPYSEYFVVFVHSTKEYKVVSLRHRLRYISFEVCTLGTQSWRTVYESEELLKRTKAVIVNDEMYWLLLDEIDSRFTGKILIFNLTDEKFSIIAVPVTVQECEIEIFEGEGKLHLLASPCKRPMHAGSEIWMVDSNQKLWILVCNVLLRIPPGQRPFFMYKRKLFFGSQEKISYLDTMDWARYDMDMPDGENIISSGLFVESFVPSITGLVCSAASLDESPHDGSSSTGSGPSSSNGARSSSTSTGHSSDLTGWSSAVLVKSFKRAQRILNMEWEMIAEPMTVCK